jgi:hypothetical protein
MLIYCDQILGDRLGKHQHLLMLTQVGCRLCGHFFLTLYLDREIHIFIDGGSLWSRHFLILKHWLDCLLPLRGVGSLLLLADDELLGAAELDVAGLRVRARLLLLALLLLDALLQLLLQLAHEVVIVAEFGVGCLAPTLGALRETLLENLLYGLDFLAYDLVEDNVFGRPVIVAADVWVGRVPRVGC